MTPEELNRAKDYARDIYQTCDVQIQNPIDVDDQSTEHYEDEHGCWVKCWAFVPKEAYQGGEAGSSVVPGG